MKNFIKLLLGTSLYLLEESDQAATKARKRAASGIDDLRDAVQSKYESASDRVIRASKALRGEDSAYLGDALRFVAGVGVGLGVGLVLAPASGKETRSAIADQVHEFGDRVRSQFSSERVRATGTAG